MIFSIDLMVCFCSYLFHYIIENQVTFLCITDDVSSHSKEKRNI